MRVLVDPEAFRHGRCGTARYYAAVCRGLRAAGIHVDVPLFASGTDFLPAPIRTDVDRPWLRRGSWLHGLVERQLARLSRRGYLRRLASGDYDVVLPTSSRYETEFLAHARGTPFVLVCHDTMRSLPIPGGAVDAWADPLHQLLYLARRAARVVCVSHATRRDLLAAAPLPPERVAVVPHANLLPLFASSGAPLSDLPAQYFLFVGSRQVRKNFHGLLHALAPLLRRPDGPALVCTGRFSPFERDFLDQLGLVDRVLGVDADDPTLVTLYQRALGLLFPSFYEGFGLPVLEAMALGCPVVTSSASSLPEVAGDAALLVDPADHAAIRHAAERLLAEPALRTRLAAAGRDRAATFTLAAMTDGLVEQLQAAAAEGAAGRG